MKPLLLFWSEKEPKRNTIAVTTERKMLEGAVSTCSREWFLRLYSREPFKFSEAT